MVSESIRKILIKQKVCKWVAATNHFLINVDEDFKIFKVFKDCNVFDHVASRPTGQQLSLSDTDL